MGRDFQDNLLCSLPLLFQSTRPRGARLGVEAVIRSFDRFNPRARVGRDSNSKYTRFGLKSFNPRARVGRDTTSMRSEMIFWCFNPRARVGRDIFFRA